MVARGVLPQMHVAGFVARPSERPGVIGWAGPRIVGRMPENGSMVSNRVALAIIRALKLAGKILNIYHAGHHCTLPHEAATAEDIGNHDLMTTWTHD